MMFKKSLLSFVFAIGFYLLASQNASSQCFQIQSILVDACGPQEGLNEMVRFQVGPTAINTSTMSVVWPNNAWEGLIKNATTAAKTAALNADIIAAGGCGQLIEPTGGVLPANAKVILVTSFNIDTTLNSFGALTENIYIIYQDNATTTAGHFANFGTGLRTLTISFNACSDAVTYDRGLLVDNTGNTVAGDGAIVTFDAAGTATYINNGCSAPVTPFTVDAGAVSVNSCPGATISLTGTAQGYQSVQWSAASGSFTNQNGLATSYTIDPLATGTVVLTLTATNSCGAQVTDTLNVILNTTTATFNPVAPICSGATLSPLPTTSTNGITGTWSPALNNTATTLYTFTPTVGQCAAGTTLTITVNTPTIPAFNAVTPICSGAALSPLPTTSTNGVTGTWSPALNNTATTLYTFTPNAGQCAQGTTLTITVNNPTTATFNPVAPICVGGTLSPLPTTSTNGITGTWSPALNNTTTTQYTFTPNAGQCATGTTLTITVNPANTIPTFNAVAPICAGAALSALPTTSTNGITGTWSPALNNTTTTQYTFTPNAGQCAQATTLTITVNNTVTPTFNTVAPICSGTALAPLPTTSNNGISGTWSPALNNTATTQYTFTPNAGQCAQGTTLTITVNPSVVPTFNAVAPICSGTALAPLPTTSINGVTGTWSPALNNNATTQYTFTPNAGQCAQSATLTITVNNSVTPTFDAVAPICAGETFPSLPTTSTNGVTGTWSPAPNNTATTTYTFTPDAGQCALGATLEVAVSTLTVALSQGCEGLHYIARIDAANSTGLDQASYTWKDSNGNVVGTNDNLDVTALLANDSNVDFPVNYTLTVENTEGCSRTANVSVPGIFCSIPKGISPNNDGKNDTFDLIGMGVKELTILNRYGTEVFHYKNYTDQFKGLSSDGKTLPDATYFYVVVDGNGKTYTGWVYINK